MNNLNHIYEDFYFKKTLFGNMVLMRKKPYPSESPGTWKYKWVKASEHEAQGLMVMMDMINKDFQTFKALKLNNPELFL